MSDYPPPPPNHYAGGLWGWGRSRGGPADHGRHRPPGSRTRAHLIHAQNAQHEHTATHSMHAPMRRGGLEVQASSFWYARLKPGYSRCYVRRIFRWAATTPSATASDLPPKGQGAQRWGFPSSHLVHQCRPGIVGVLYFWGPRREKACCSKAAARRAWAVGLCRASICKSKFDSPNRPFVQSIDS